MQTLYVKSLALLDQLVASVRHDWVWWAVVVALLVLACLGYAALALTTVFYRVARLQRLMRKHQEQQSEYRQEVIDNLRATHYYLRELSEKLGSSLPHDVKVGSIQAENLVVQPPQHDGRNRERDYR